MLLVSGANVPLERLPGFVRAVGSGLPLTHGIQAGRILGGGGSFGTAGPLLAREALVGCCYLLLGVVMLRLLEYEGRRSAALETF
jgi:ABC-2 type transport system permease protein